MRILLIGEGDFSYTFAMIKDLKSTQETIDIIATDYDRHDIKTLEDKALSLQLPQNMTLSFYDQMDATKPDQRIKGKFNRIILNFPTPLGIQAFKMEKLFENIAKERWLADGGSLDIAYWVDEYAGTYEYAYRLAKAQKKNGFKLVSREIFDIDYWRKRGYERIIHSGEKNIIDRFPVLAKYEQKVALEKPLDEKEYAELSDSEDLPSDGRPNTRGWTNFLSSHKIDTLNIHGEQKYRWQYKLSVFKENPQQYTMENVFSLLKKKKYRLAEKILNLYVFEASQDNQYRHKLFQWHQVPGYIINKIREDYESLPEKMKPTQQDLNNYHNLTWYSQLKVLTGVRIPTLLKYYKWN